MQYLSHLEFWRHSTELRVFTADTFTEEITTKIIQGVVIQMDGLMMDVPLSKPYFW